MNKNTILNEIYEPVYNHSKNFVSLAKRRGLDSKIGFFNMHLKKIDGDFKVEYFPIPVVTISEICDVGFDFDRTFVEFKVSRDFAIKFGWKTLSCYDFELFGCKNYLNDFYCKKSDINDINRRILNSDEQEVCAEFTFKYLEQASKLFEFISIINTALRNDAF